MKDFIKIGEPMKSETHGEVQMYIGVSDEAFTKQMEENRHKICAALQVPKCIMSAPTRMPTEQELELSNQLLYGALLGSFLESFEL